MNLSKEDLITAIHGKSGRYRLDQVKIVTPDKVYKGAGIVDCRDRLEVSITLPKRSAVPVSPRGVVARKDFWRLEGVLEGSHRISVGNLMPHYETNTTNGITTLVFHVDQLDLAASGSDRITGRQIQKFLSAQRAKNAKTAEGETTKRKPVPRKPAQVTFFAVLKNYRPIARNKGTDVRETNDFLGPKLASRQDTYMGTLPSWKYGLIQVNDDLHVHLRSLENYRSKSQDEDERHFASFLQAIAFTHGKHAWPSQLEYRKDHKLLTDRIKTVGDVSSTAHAPFSESMWGNAHVGRIQWDLSDPLQKAYQFFLANTALSKEIAELLYLFREAGADGVPLRVSLLTLCTLYESLMRSAHAHLLGDKEKTDEVKEFNRLKARLVAQLLKRKNKVTGAKVAAYARLIGLLSSASAESIREIVQAVASHFWSASPLDWTILHKEWANNRNPLSHKIAGKGDQDGDLRGELFAVSHIAGAINAIILKLMGYSGMARISTFEDGYKVI
jgi:hypothetical protein